MNEQPTVNISLIIDDDTKCSLCIDLSFIDKDKLKLLCSEVGTKYNISQLGIQLLYSKLKKELEQLISIKADCNTGSNQRKKELLYQVTNRLYYNGIKQKKEKEVRSKETYERHIEEEAKQYSFHPKINTVSKLLYKKSHRKIEERSYDKRRALNTPCYRNKSKTESKLNNELSDIVITTGINSHNKINNNRLTGNNTKEAKDVLAKQMYYFTQEKTNKNKKKIVNSSKINQYEHKKAFSDHETKVTTRFNSKTNDQFTSMSNNDSKINKNMNDSQSIQTNNDLTELLDINYTQSNFNDYSKISQSTEQLNCNTKPNPIIVNQTNLKSRNKLQWHERLHQTQTQTKSKSKSKTGISTLSPQYSFKPKLSKGSQRLMRDKRESKEGHVTRLSSSKLHSSLSKSLQLLITSKPHLINTNANRTSKQVKKNNGTGHRNIYSSLSEHSKSTNIKDIIKDSKLNQLIIQHKRDQSYSIDLYKETMSNNVKLFNYNKIKSLYNIIIANDNKIDLNSLLSCNIPKHLTEVIIIPACFIINNNNYDFNFQTFYSIITNLLNYYIN